LYNPPTHARSYWRTSIERQESITAAATVGFPFDDLLQEMYRNPARKASVNQKGDLERWYWDSWQEREIDREGYLKGGQ